MNLNYYNTFILVAEDSIADHGEIPNTKRQNKTVGEIQFELLNGHDYKYMQEEVLFETHMLHKNIPEEAREAEREAFFSKSQACMRTSPLGKRYGWGLHFNQDGYVKLVAVDNPEYLKLANQKDLTITRAMKSKR
ncbi:DUF6157 family protein [Paenilisteria rocourtiae]|uniref:Uncharacterized protein n=1 Tax=Listeria rocourtiae TaxID=647910 RepID=A0A4R6ZGG0_9LIST|nr:DUF6157 family protein [Listeria rocourtiae]EUJ43056.1 hypothetical protein PROCOU_15988 [Listeria rocourtiae FSL F6-920]MBC1605629.1 hypothetical protein [Listeria rocourtiae]TDR51347.1 hypothetical protein DFP96_11338 [Listeria rocourtiae]